VDVKLYRALNKKESDIQDVADLLGEMRKQSLIEDAALSEGLKDQVEFLDDVSIDVPQAYKFMASEYLRLVSEK